MTAVMKKMPNTHGEVQVVYISPMTVANDYHITNAKIWHVVLKVYSQCTYVYTMKIYRLLLPIVKVGVSSAPRDSACSDLFYIQGPQIRGNIKLRTYSILCNTMAQSNISTSKVFVIR